MSRPVAIDLFCGAGGMSRGFELAGFNVALGIDSDDRSIESFQINHPNAKIICDDIRNVGKKRIIKELGHSNIDVVVGGPPCQGYSIAGERNPKDPRNKLFLEFLRLVKELKPSWFVMENVTGLLSARDDKGKYVKDVICKKFKDAGYKIEYKVLNAANFGIPQMRKRVIFIGTNTKNTIEFPSETGKYVPVKTVLLDRKIVPEKYFLSKKMIDGFKKRINKNRNEGRGFGWQILDMKKPSYTIPARYWKDGSNALVTYRDGKFRMLTELECARIQGFNNDYIFIGNKREKYTQIGNCVPPPVSQAVGKILLGKFIQSFPNSSTISSDIQRDSFLSDAPRI